MKLTEAIARVDRSGRYDGFADIETMCKALSIDYCYHGYTEFAERVKEYWLIKWQCTATWVGTRVYYMDDEPIAISTQNARKSDERVRFVSVEAADKIRAFIFTLMQEDKADVQLIDDTEEVDEFYRVDHASALLVDDGFYKGQPVKHIRPKCPTVLPVGTHWGYGYLTKLINVQLPDENIIEIDVREFDIPLCIKEAA